MKLAGKAFLRLLIGMSLVAIAIFPAAGGWNYWNGWLLMGVLFVPMLLMGALMLLYSPQLLEKRMKNREEARVQRWVVRLSGLMFVVNFLIAGLGYRYGWMMFPGWIVWLGVAIFLFSYILYAEVMRENVYLSRIIEVQKGQKVVDTGMYRIVRHPMYAATLFMFLAIPLILGSVISFLIMLLYIPIIRLRIRNEEHLLESELTGYKEYKNRVRYRLIPYLW